MSHETRGRPTCPGDTKQPHTHGAAPVDVATPGGPPAAVAARRPRGAPSRHGGPTLGPRAGAVPQLQRLLHEGLFAATYKYALLLVIADVCVEQGDDPGGGRTG